MYYYRGDRGEHDSPRIAFYARVSTPRRAVELGREALLILHERGYGFGSICSVRTIWVRRCPMSMSIMGCCPLRNWAPLSLDRHRHGLFGQQLFADPDAAVAGVTPDVLAHQQVC